MLKLFRHMLVIGCIISLLAITTLSINSEDDLETKKVLFISSYNAGFATLPGQIDGLNSVFNEGNIVLDIDYMDTKQHHELIHYENYYNFLKARLDDGIAYDAVVVGDDNGLQFLMDYQDQLFPDTPIVFFCVNDIERAKEASNLARMTGIVEAISLEENIELAIELFPSAKRFVGIVDETNTGQGDAYTFMEAASDYSDIEFELVNSSEYTFDEFETVLADISSSDVIFYLSMFEDKTGATITINEAIDIITDSANAPVIRMSIGGVGDGILGGQMVSYEEQGRVAAELVVSVLKGMDIDTMALVTESPNKYYFDYEIMKAYHISIDDVPEGSIIINEPINVFVENKGIIIPALIVIALMALFIFILVYDNRRLKAKDEELQENNMELSAMYEEITATEEELRNQYDQVVLSQEKLNESEERYRILAYTDTLTSLNNREAMMRFIDEKVKEETTGWHLIYIDLDNFKYINDSRGHEVGDEVLKNISERFIEYKAEIDYVCRLGGDEFVIIVDVGKCDIELLIQKIMSRIEESIDVGSSTFYLTCSMGIASFPIHGRERDVLLRRADMAMYSAKVAGKSRYSFYEKNMEIVATEKLMVQSRIRHALGYDEFELFYQPQCNISTGEMCGVEALIRWKDSNGQYISPSLFIPIAEEQGIIRLIGLWVYEEAAKKAKRWAQKYGSPFNYSVNVSAAEVIDEGFAFSFIEVLKKYGIDGKYVAVEVTETIFIESKEKAEVQLNILRNYGIHIHLDDFGSGYSSLNYLINFPLDVVKIDRQFIKDIKENEKYQDMTQSIIDISHRLDLKIIAEGVETKEQLELLKGMKCDLMQGYYYAKPMPYDALEDFYS